MSDTVVGRIEFNGMIPKEDLEKMRKVIFESPTGKITAVHPAPTFFPQEVQRAMERLANAVDGGFESEVVNDSYMLLRELREWEKAWRAGTARLVPQVETKANGEGGL